ncbi:MAG TPA: gamma-glutamyltransferase [Thermoanaerobaculia bacterium]|nr:gamma-glutamyltransferase [Thermoanaerobaculia bacterium]
MKTRVLAAALVLAAAAAFAQKTQKPPLHGAHWMAVTGKPLAATAGAMIFERGGNAVDAAAAMIAAACTMWDTLSWGGETQALVYDPHTKNVTGINALGVAPTGATADFFKGKGMKYPPEYGPLAAVTPGTPGGILVMEAEYGKLSLKEILAPAIAMADGYPIEQELINTIIKYKSRINEWPYAKAVMLPHGGKPPVAGEMFRQPELAATLRKLVDAEEVALKAGKSRKEAIYAAYDRFYKGDIAREIVRGVQEQGGLFTLDDLAKWQVHIEEPVKTSYRGIDVYKLNVWTQGPSMLQALNILENFDLKSMGYNSARYIHTLYQALSLAYADRDFYYGDIYTPPAKPVRGLLSKEYAKERAKLVRADRNDPDIAPGDPYPFQGETNPFTTLLKTWTKSASADVSPSFYAGTTSVEAVDAEGWAVSVTPSGGWVPAVIAGHTGVGLSQRMQSFVTDASEGPFNVIEPGKHPRVTLTPTLAFKDGAPYLVFSVQGGDSQDQNLLQFFLNVVEFGMTPQEATEAANFNTYQMRSSFGNHEIVPGKILLNAMTPPWVRGELRKMGYTETFEERTSGPINAILIDRAHGTFWGGSSNHGEDYGIGW